MRPNGLSTELQTGKAAEHLVCCDLILQGYSAFLADAGLPYDGYLHASQTSKSGRSGRFNVMRCFLSRSRITVESRVFTVAW
jgi:hypothetical protein